MFNNWLSCPVLVTTLSPNFFQHVAASQGVLPDLLAFFNHAFFNHSFVNSYFINCCSNILL